MVDASENRVCAVFGSRLHLLMGAISTRPKLAAIVCQAGSLIHEAPTVAEVVRELFEDGAEHARRVALALERPRPGVASPAAGPR